MDQRKVITTIIKFESTLFHWLLSLRSYYYLKGSKNFKQFGILFFQFHIHVFQEGLPSNFKSKTHSNEYLARINLEHH